ncbi:hypothetical protein EMIHUDRAFT_197838 [Emiliania huxleyi CCMP1516]|uniref:Cytochrome c domain-containing protein n=2 Tax=Emiliania huxleyi TaxID=2903 RepID=A0A0D3IDU5_EMIH1|nr:hypothetical protein EMIHUDRAFT_197838 [Emiliania huxleyi CCMP1516]EOD09430.1 hypothetical protein EMIHUDRAFT_197838 [Emiliania huxleyi CCMP1516]|eukprot:XP_005761859.1 hypothetical protein EMIHUDRAFT_197838 [Emiliania huxleyi CCMP1516]
MSKDAWFETLLSSLAADDVPSDIPDTPPVPPAAPSQGEEKPNGIAVPEEALAAQVVEGEAAGEAAEALAHLKLSELRQRLAAAGVDGTAVDEALDEAAETGSNPKQALVALLQKRVWLSNSTLRLNALQNAAGSLLNSPVALRLLALQNAAGSSRARPSNAFRPQRLRDQQDARRGGRTVKAALCCSLPAACTLAAVGMALGALLLRYAATGAVIDLGAIAGNPSCGNCHSITTATDNINQCNTDASLLNSAIAAQGTTADFRCFTSTRYTSGRDFLMPAADNTNFLMPAAYNTNAAFRCNSEVSALNAAIMAATGVRTTFGCYRNDWLTNGYLQYWGHTACTAGGTQESNADIVALNQYLSNLNTPPPPPPPPSAAPNVEEAGGRRRVWRGSGGGGGGEAAWHG